MVSIQLESQQKVAENASLLRFFRPKDYTFEPGQYAYLTLLKKKYPDYDNHSRILSFSSAPTESTLDFLVRLGNSGFKQELTELKTGDLVEIGSPIGSFTFQPKNTKVICIAGGIGIAPFFSLFKSVKTNKADISLVWSNRSSQSTPLFQEMQNLITKFNTFNFFPLLTRVKEAETPFLNGRISHQWLDSNDLITKNAHYLLCGSTAFVTEISNMLKDSNIPIGHIKLEAFSGYE